MTWLSEGGDVDGHCRSQPPHLIALIGYLRDNPFTLLSGRYKVSASSVGQTGEGTHLNLIIQYIDIHLILLLFNLPGVLQFL